MQSYCNETTLSSKQKFQELNFLITAIITPKPKTIDDSHFSLMGFMTKIFLGFDGEAKDIYIDAIKVHNGKKLQNIGVKRNAFSFLSLLYHILYCKGK